MGNIILNSGQLFFSNEVYVYFLTLYMPKNRQSESESDFMPANASPPGFAVPYNFSISLTCSFCFRTLCGYMFSCGITTHLALKKILRISTISAM